jgi:error-prone DNA polymerase
MGFYSASQLVQDARRHGVEVQPVDVAVSSWESTLEGDQLASVRLGLHQVRNFPAAAGARIVTAREEMLFADLADLARRAELTRADLDALAAAGALTQLAGHRRQAAWMAAAIPLQRDLFAGVALREEVVSFTAPREGEDIAADYRSLGLTLGRHPLALLRATLAAKRYLSARDLRERGNNAVVRCAGIVTCRQRPGTASGVIFVTLEDETGCANVVVFKDLASSQRRLLLGSRLLGVAGQLQREGEGEHAVVHLIAKRLFDHSELLGSLVTASRDFH